MYLAMLKKDLKQFFRSKFNVIILLIFPIILITTLAVGLKSIMSGSNIFHENENEIVYYNIIGESPYESSFLEFTKTLDDNIHINFKEISDLNIVKEDINNYKALAYVEFNGEDIKYYSSESGEKTEGKIFKEIFNSFLSGYGTYKTIESFDKNAFNNFVANKYDSYVKQEVLNDKKELGAGEFYTFAELALIIMFLGQTIGEVTFKEKQLRTVNRIVMSKGNHFKMMLSKISLGVIIGTLQTLLVYLYTSLVLKINWGENTIKFIALFIVFSLFVSVVGAVIGALAKTEGVVSGGLNIFAFLAGALGGCFTPLSMIISIPIINKLVYISPVYWISTATSTMICGFETIAYIIALAIPIILALIFLFIYFIAVKRKGGLISV